MKRNLNDIVEECFDFIRAYGSEAVYASDQWLRDSLRWYLSHDRALVLRDQEGLVGVTVWHIVRSPHDIVPNQWPEEDPEGRWMYVPFSVLHPMYQGKSVVWGLINYVKSKFPKVKYLYFERGEDQNEASYVVPIKGRSSTYERV